MSARTWFENYPKAGLAISVVALSLAILALLYATGVFGGDTPTSSSKFYFYDMQTQALFADEADRIPPIKAPSGGEGVVAQVYDCGDCEGGHFIALLTKYTPKAKQAIEKDMPPPASGELIRLPDDSSDWVRADSDAAAKMRLEAAAAAREFCKGQSPSICFPQ